MFHLQYDSLFLLILPFNFFLFQVGLISRLLTYQYKIIIVKIENLICTIIFRIYATPIANIDLLLNRYLSITLAFLFNSITWTHSQAKLFLFLFLFLHLPVSIYLCLYLSCTSILLP